MAKEMSTATATISINVNDFNKSEQIYCVYLTEYNKNIYYDKMTTFRGGLVSNDGIVVGTNVQYYCKDKKITNYIMSFVNGRFPLLVRVKGTGEITDCCLWKW